MSQQEIRNPLVTANAAAVAGPAATRDSIVVALIGNPNSGKTSIFNAITGGRQHVGNWPGVTVEKKSGHVRRGGVRIEVVDLPGTYSLTTFSPEEIVARNFMILDKPDVVINVVDCSNLDRNLYLTTQLLTLGVPLVLAFNMSDVAEANGIRIDDRRLSQLLGAPIVRTVGSRGKGIDDILAAAVAVAADIPAALSRQHSVDHGPELEVHVRELTEAIAARDAKKCGMRNAECGIPASDAVRKTASSPCNLQPAETKPSSVPKAVEKEISHSAFRTPHSNCSAGCKHCPSAMAPLAPDTSRRHHRWLATKLLEDDIEAPRLMEQMGIADVGALRAMAGKARQHIEHAMRRPAEILLADMRYGFINGACAQSVQRPPSDITLSDRIDRIITHRFLGLPIFALMMYMVFQMTFSLGRPLVDLLDAGKEHLADWVRTLGGDGQIWMLARGLLADGIIEGVGAVVSFVPLIMLLYLGIAILEDSGYMARAAYVLDRMMGRIGLHGKSFIPMLIGFGCTVPGIMATRILENRRDRLTTMMVLPLMSCGARLPVYVLLLGALFPDRALVHLGPVPLTLQAVMLFGLYTTGIVLAIVCSKIMRSTLFRGEVAPLVMELPPYRRPAAMGLAIHMWERGWQYLKKAGTVILGIVIILWIAKTWPMLPQAQTAGFDQQRQAVVASVAPVGEQRVKLHAIDSQEHLEQLQHSAVGRIGRALEPALKPAGLDWRVATAMVGAFAAKEVFISQMGIVYAVGDDAGEDSSSLRQKLAHDYTPLQGISMLLLVLIATPCLATIAVTIRESGSWKWGVAQWLYLTVLAWVLAVVVYQAGRAMGA